MTSLSIEVFGAPYTVVNGLVNVPRCGKLHLYAQKKKPELETAIEMQKRIEEDTVDAQRIKVRRLFCACTRSSTPALSHVVRCLAGQFSSGPRSRGAQHALAPWGNAYSLACLAAASAIVGCKREAFTRLSRDDAVAAAPEAAWLRRSCGCVDGSA
jgi:hypothetical protein